MQLLLTIEDANTVALDRSGKQRVYRENFRFPLVRWNLSWVADPSLLPSNRSPSPGNHGNSTAILTSPQSVVMNNYCGIGLDAAIALEFHNAREEKPDKFNSRSDTTLCFFLELSRTFRNLLFISSIAGVFFACPLQLLLFALDNFYSVPGFFLTPSHPHRFHNKGVYFQLGLQKMVTKSECSNLQRHIRLVVSVITMATT